ncbi:hypothetical protein K431DRAFT_286241 [Polychaeton citri CBS 116435]|uniref:DUF2406 domain-containing protein n=1 Tax=Polychaeton citri CBS 116435 TaxID=1314669 RepID=A0A9P4Q8E7_9PEZI|nr:hypothetical protein K431DRAFT_286241 [Polychaeton citri CBS 116435]
MDQPPTSPGSRNRAFSFRSDRSGGSKGSKPKIDLVESAREKERRDSIWRNTSKANPNAALGEAQPGERATAEQTTLDSIRDLQHKDGTGNVIAEPDLVNPTRPRWERPLDTIRSFERNIDNGYRRRSTMRSDSYEQPSQYQRRNSSYGNGYDQGPSPGRHSQMGSGGYYANRSPSGYDNGYPNGGGPSSSRQRYPPRMQSDHGVRYPGNPPQHGYHSSYDTVNTGASDSTGPWGNSTDPSSENSSLDRVNATMKPQDGYPAGAYPNPNGFQGPIPEEQGSGSYNPGYPAQGMPVQPPAGRRPIALGNSTSSPPTKLPTGSRPEPEKRKSWLKRRFSKKD